MDDGDTLESLQQTAESITGVLVNKQVLARGNRPITGSGSLKTVGITDGDVIMLVQQQALHPRQQQPGGNPGDSQLMATNPDGSFMYPEEVIARLRGNQHALADLRRRMPQQAAAIEQGNVQELQAIMRQVRRRLPSPPPNTAAHAAELGGQAGLPYTMTSSTTDT